MRRSPGMCRLAVPHVQPMLAGDLANIVERIALSREVYQDHRLWLKDNAETLLSKSRSAAVIYCVPIIHCKLEIVGRGGTVFRAS